MLSRQFPHARLGVHKIHTFIKSLYLQACSILYKSKLPMLLVFNKTDVARHQFALDWMADFETFHVALQADSTFASTLSRSLSLVRHSAVSLAHVNVILWLLP